ncbi:hypothetical protein GP486_003957 [Trichoglossum hirsutum]|uniref:Heterokaryon incompatibility domain-containing protein n=1 Tax=Trichoglossum hirsutum TaxID=265104 RepID=A0A9P8RPX6_9PEZI|nr:hypothetical protein GP486_003957 [Trichoglossum hirsutum]
MDQILAYLLQDIPRMRAEDGETDTGALVDRLANNLGSLLSVDKETVHDIGQERKDALRNMYEASKQKLAKWYPEGIQFRSKSFEDWLRSWIWTPLSGDPNHLEQQSLGYFALSYVWRDQAPVTLGTKNRELDLMVAASGLTMHQALERTNMSPEMIDEVCGQVGGLAGDSAEIIIDKASVTVGKTLELALRTLREIPEVANGTRVWVDAICINQQDVEEKNVEVKRMGEIYRKADRVVSYLGEEEDDSGHILEFMDAIGEVMQQAKVLAPITLGFIRDIQPDMAVSMAKLLLRTYFSRVWVVQEIALSGGKGIAICGARRFSWTNILRCGKILNAGIAAALWNFDMRLGPLGTGEDEDYFTVADLKKGITKLQMLRDAHIDSRRQEDKEDEFYKYHDVPRSNTLWFRIPSSNDATDSRDLVYGMMNLLPKKLANLIHVDYSSSNQFVDVMRSFSEAHITSTQSLDWILHRYYMPFIDHQAWPTWVPNLAQQFSSIHWEWAAITGGSACPNVQCDASFAMARNSKKPLLVCKGMRVDTVHTATKNMVKDAAAKKKAMIQMLVNSITAENAQHVYSMIEELQHSIRKQLSLIIPDDDDEATPNTGIATVGASTSTSTHRYDNAESLKAALNHCFSTLQVKLEGGQNIFNFPLDISPEDDTTLRQTLTSPEFRTPMVTIFNQFREFFADFNLWGMPFRDLFPPRAAEVSPSSFSPPNIDGNGIMLVHLFTTSDGYVGASLGNVRAGDEVFLLAGCSMPVLLKKSRAAPGIYELRGGVHIPGLMKGEKLSSKDRIQDDFETILIC